MNTLTLKNIGPIGEAEITPGDLTVLVGPQATGKSIALQMLKLLVDKGHVHQQLEHYGIDWDGDQNAFLDAYFGEGMHAIWGPKSEISKDGKRVDLKTLVRKAKPNGEERAFLVPAQRVLVLRNGWPRTFGDYAPGDPFAVRDFSEKLRGLVEQEFIGKDMLFPQKGRLKTEFREMLSRHVFANFGLRVHKLASQKRLVLAADANAQPLPYMVWSAGQREFVPLLLGLYWLMPPTKVSRRGAIEWVMLEEIEMGLHPRAINAVMLMVLELVRRGYKVCLTTHSPQVLETVWALSRLQLAGADASAVLRLFDAKGSSALTAMAQDILTKTYRVYSFGRASGSVRVADISSLDPDSASKEIAGWGGLAEFSDAANMEVARAVSRAGATR
ncbi:MAG: AAA family ATPase [Phycisphaerales bacterium]